MFSVFKITDLGDGYILVEPPAGLLPEIHKRTRLYSDAEKLTGDILGAIFILACLHKDDVPVFGLIADTVPECIVEGATNPVTKTIRSAYSLLPDDEFKAVIAEFLFGISRETLDKWFEAVDASCYITKKRADEVKND